jgi:2-phospho-L-lactate guanylyltransferase (CobY/MobA/RfbA family)
MRLTAAAKSGVMEYIFTLIEATTDLTRPADVGEIRHLIEPGR